MVGTQANNAQRLRYVNLTLWPPQTQLSAASLLIQFYTDSLGHKGPDLQNRTLHKFSQTLFIKYGT